MVENKMTGRVRDGCGGYAGVYFRGILVLGLTRGSGGKSESSQQWPSYQQPESFLIALYASLCCLDISIKNVQNRAHDVIPTPSLLGPGSTFHTAAKPEILAHPWIHFHSALRISHSGILILFSNIFCF